MVADLRLSNQNCQGQFGDEKTIQVNLDDQLPVTECNRPGAAHRMRQKAARKSTFVLNRRSGLNETVSSTPVIAPACNGTA